MTTPGGGTQEKERHIGADFGEQPMEAATPSPTRDFQEEIMEVKESLSEVEGTVHDAGRQRFDDLKDMASDTYHEGRDQVKKWKHGLEETIQQYPLASLAIAVGIGAALGGLFGRKFRG